MQRRSRWSSVLGLVSLVLFSAGSTVGGILVLVLADGLWDVMGAALLVVVATSLWTLFGPRSPRAVVVTTAWRGLPALLLPRRRGHVTTLCVATLAFAVAAGLLGWLMIQAGETGSGRRSPLAGLLAGAVFLGYGSWMSVRAAMGGGRVLITGDGLVTTGLAYRSRLVAWRGISQLVPLPGLATSSEIRLAPRAALEHRGRPLLVPVARVAWRDQQTRDVLRWLLKQRAGKAVHRGLAGGPSPAEHQALADEVTAFARSVLPPGRIRS